MCMTSISCKSTVVTNNIRDLEEAVCPIVEDVHVSVVTFVLLLLLKYESALAHVVAHKQVHVQILQNLLANIDSACL
jgi:hypothetical protein